MRTLLLILLSLIFSTCDQETCFDGVLNNNEAFVDCGGPCKYCASCRDHIRNQDETGVDCGGVCKACPTCSDGLRNQDETGVDCGGSCTPCIRPTMTGNIGQTNWTANIVTAAVNSKEQLVISGTDGSRKVTIYIPPPLFATEHALKAGEANMSIGNFYHCECLTGKVNVVTHDLDQRVITADYSFDCKSSGSGEVRLIEGKFSNIAYK